jgi:hypothetical protein
VQQVCEGCSCIGVRACVDGYGFVGEVLRLVGVVRGGSTEGGWVELDVHLRAKLKVGHVRWLQVATF